MSELYNSFSQMRTTIIYKNNLSAYDEPIVVFWEWVMRSLVVNVLIAALTFWGVLSLGLST